MSLRRQTRNRLTLLLLAVGLGAAVVIYLAVPPAVVDPLLGDPSDSKNYVRELRLYGGRANVLSAEFQDWFAGLWHGQTLAYTVAVLTVLLTLVFRFFTPQIPLPDQARAVPAEPVPPPGPAADKKENRAGSVSP